MVTTVSKILTTPPSSEPRVQELLKLIGPGNMSDVAYDTAWVARLGEIDWDLSNRALGWLSDHQLSDGSWGAERIFYYHDRLISTLAAMIALTYRGRRAQDQEQIERGLNALERIVDSSSSLPQADHDGATVGFEMIVPTLVAEAERIGLIRQRGDQILGRIAQQRSQKLAYIKGRTINRHVTMAHSAEMAGLDGQAMLDIEDLQERNGSLGCSPSATAYFALYVARGDPKAVAYLNRVCRANGGVPNVAPIDIFEVAWTLWNLSMIPGYSGLDARTRQHLDFLSQAWDYQHGGAFSSEFSVNDSDESSMVFDTLSRHGIQKDIEYVLSYEDQKWFRCFDLESDPSISANIHILGALRQAGFRRQDGPVEKILRFLQFAVSPQGFWKDKWHISPYYTTSHAVMACADYASDIASAAVDWLVRSQKPDGSWGILHSTAEETAYAMQALWIWHQKVRRVPRECLYNGKVWLEEHQADPYDPLWIGKGLYSPTLVIDSAVITALSLPEV